MKGFLLQAFVAPIIKLDVKKRDRVWQALQAFIAARKDPSIPAVAWMDDVYLFTRRFELEVREREIRVKADASNVLATLKAGSRHMKGDPDVEKLILKAVLEEDVVKPT